MCNPVLEETRAWVKRYFERKRIRLPKKQPVSNKARKVQKGLVISKVISKRQQVFESTGGLCWYCGTGLSLKGVENQMTIDHVLPRSKGGSRGLGNLVPACRGCNLSKGDLALEVFRQSVGIGVFWGESLT